MTPEPTVRTALTAKALDTYTDWLQQQPLARSTKASYLAQVRRYLQWISDEDDCAALLPDHTATDRLPAASSTPSIRQGAKRKVTIAIGDYKQWMLTTRRLAPRTVNQALAAVQNFYRSRGLLVDTTPVVITPQAPRFSPPDKSLPSAATPQDCLPATGRSSSPSCTPACAAEN